MAENEEIEEIEEMEDMDEFEEPDIMDAMSSFFATESGETIADLMSGVKDATEKIAFNFELQNKILVKILAELRVPKA